MFWLSEPGRKKPWQYKPSLLCVNFIYKGAKMYLECVTLNKLDLIFHSNVEHKR